MKKRELCVIESNKLITSDVCEMVLETTEPVDFKAGQFVNVTVPGVFLPRPISVSFSKDYILKLVYRIVGEGTANLASLNSGDSVDILAPLGNGFDLDNECEKPLLIGGGLGVAPLRQLVYDLKKLGKEPRMIVGFKSKSDAILLEELRDLCKVVATYETSERNRLVTDVLKELTPEDYDYFYACGPKPMLKAVSDMALTDGEVSLEARMACGIGQCKCCSIETNDGMKTLCKDGPVLKKGLVRW